MDFHSYFDESGLAAEDNFFILAGWNARVEVWEQFSDAWLDICEQHPSIPFFTTDKVTDPEKRRDLAEVIASHNLDGYVCLVPRAVFDTRPKRFKGLFGSRLYDWAFADAIMCVTTRQREKGETGIIDFTFEHRNELKAAIDPDMMRRWKSAMPEELRRLVGTPVAKHDDELPPLQAADMLAGEILQQLRFGEPSDIWPLWKDLKIGRSIMPVENALNMNNTLKVASAMETLVRLAIKRLREDG
ncbi:DUF3800 domain-containing protein [Granulicella aggregans]|uniref:DUF3800 domain-containing protein n=1 Tax=Granulicella aggregans TaxID=474949 RepID=UPI0021E019E7|nr:DUF3800 domain-containing protein [Granulicella aggregans]